MDKKSYQHLDESLYKSISPDEYFYSKLNNMLQPRSAFNFLNKEGQIRNFTDTTPEHYQKYEWRCGKWMPVLSEAQYEEFIETLAELCEGKRSDVTDICNTFLDSGELPEASDIEHRYIRAELPEDCKKGTSVIYDTLTTLIEVEVETDDVWKECDNHEYTDN